MKIRHLLSHCKIWCADFVYTLFDFSFSQTITTRMLPLLYGLGILALVAIFGYLGLLAFMDHWFKGVVYAAILAPIGLTFGIAIIRIFLEFFSAVFTMLKALKSTLAAISRLDNTFDVVQEDIAAIRRRFTEMTLTLDSVESKLASMEAIVLEMDEIATKIPFLKSRKGSRSIRSKNTNQKPTPPEIE